jgi:hypothetical protein
MSKNPFKGPLQTPRGELTADGIAFIRRRFREYTEGGAIDFRRRRKVSELSDERLNEEFHRQPAWLEAVMQAGQPQKPTINSDLDFVLRDSTRRPLTLRLVAECLEAAFTAGNTGHSLDVSFLDHSVFGFVDSLVRRNDPTIKPAYDACESLSDPAMRRRWEEFKWAQNKGNPRPFFLGNVGDKRPDRVEVNLSSGEIAVIDATFAYGDKIHNFKTAFYKAALEHMIKGKITIKALDYRAPGRQTKL